MSSEEQTREVRSFLNARDPSIDRRFRPRPDRAVRLFGNIDEEELTDSTSTTSSTSYTSVKTEECSASGIDESNNNNGGASSALVYLRLRPVDAISASYAIAGNVLVTGATQAQEATNSKINRTAVEKQYRFSAIFNSDVDQCEVYGRCILRQIAAESNFAVLSYGTSGSGKTFTLLGDDIRPGIIPRALEQIFSMYRDNIYPQPAMKLVKGDVVIMEDAAMAKENERRNNMLAACEDTQKQQLRLQQLVQADHEFTHSTNSDMTVMIWVSFVEIYNECVHDLLATMPNSTGAHAHAQWGAAPPSRKNLRIIGNDGKVFVRDLSAVYVKNSMEANQLLRYGLQRANYASTTINANSSRSHCIFIVDVIKYYTSSKITQVSYKFCDLAGSERVVKTGNKGARLKEAQNINTSLMVLGRCLVAANNSTRNELVPYRESKLTMLLQSALLGKEKLTMIVNITPTDQYYEENLNVLGFASIAMNIIYKQPTKQPSARCSFLIQQSLTEGKNEYISQLLEENLFLRNEVERLQAQHYEELLRQEQELRIQLVDKFRNTLEQTKAKAELRKKQELDCQKRLYEQKISSLKRQHEDELEDLREEYEKEKDKENPVANMPTKRRTMN